jgi:hypothetical protein
MYLLILLGKYLYGCDMMFSMLVFPDKIVKISCFLHHFRY